MYFQTTALYILASQDTHFFVRLFLGHFIGQFRHERGERGGMTCSSAAARTEPLYERTLHQVSYPGAPKIPTLNHCSQCYRLYINNNIACPI